MADLIMARSASRYQDTLVGLEFVGDYLTGELEEHLTAVDACYSMVATCLLNTCFLAGEPSVNISP